MPYERDDEIRRAARERLQSRMERRGSASTLASNSPAENGTRGRAPQGGNAQMPRSQQQMKRKSPHPISTGGRHPQLYTMPTASRSFDLGPISIPLPDFIPPIAVPIAALVIVLLLVFGLIVPSCTRSPEQATQESQAAESNQSDVQQNTASDASSTASDQASTVQQVADAKAQAETAVQNASQVSSVDKQESHQAALATLLGEEISAKLLAQAKTSPEALWIAAHPDAFAIDGVEVQYKILKLAAEEPEAIDFVRGFPTSYPQENASTDRELAMDEDSPVSSVPDTDIPHFYQWDRRWGYTTYSSAAFGLTGCGPTSFAMVYQGLTGKDDKTPYDMAKLAQEGGYMAEYEGTSGAFFIEMAEQMGLSCEEMYPDVEAAKSAIEHGHVIIANLAPGYFTQTGHFFVIAGLTPEGQAIVNDPYSVERSSQTWDLDLIVSQSYVMYNYSKAA